MENSIKPQIAPITIRSYEQLGNTIRRIRKLIKLSQSDLAKKAGMTQTTISNLESGKTVAEVGTLLLILAALNIDMIITARLKDDKKNLLEGLF